MNVALKIEYEIDGERLATPEGIADADLRAAMQELAEELREELADVRCPEHDVQPMLVLSEEEGEITVGVESCCEKLEDIMEERFTDGDTGDV